MNTMSEINHLSTRQLYLNNLYETSDKNLFRESGAQDSDLFDGYSIGVVKLTNELIQSKADTLVLLDRSARPIAQLFKSYWREVYQESEMPSIRFINIGQESKKYNNSDKSLKELYNAHSNSFNGKTVLVADECVVTGSTLLKAKYILESTFPSTNKFIYTAVLDVCPKWYNLPSVLGVYDLSDFAVKFGGGLKKDIIKNNPDSFVSKSIRGFVAKNNLGNDSVSESLEKRQRRLNRLRKELSVLGKIVAKNTYEKPVDAKPVFPIFPINSLGKKLNG